MKIRYLFLFVALTRILGAQAVLNPHRVTLSGTWMPVDPNALPENVKQIYATYGGQVPDGSCVFTVKLGPNDKKPLRYVQASDGRHKADGSCEMDYDVGEPADHTPAGKDAPAARDLETATRLHPNDSGGGNGTTRGSGGLTVSYKDPLNLNVTQLWVGQTFNADGTCISNQSAWPGSWQLTATGWVNGGYTFTHGLNYVCPNCGGLAYASATNGIFVNGTFCYALTGQYGNTYVNYTYVSDYGFPDGSTQYTWSAVASGACAGLLHYYVTFT